MQCVQVLMFVIGSGRPIMPNSSSLLSKQPPDSPQHTILLGIIGVLFAWDFEDCREGGGVGVDAVPNFFRNL